MDYVSYSIIVEEISRACASTGVLISAHTSLCVYPILNFGNEEQKKKYLPKLASGEHIGCFCLSWCVLFDVMFVCHFVRVFHLFLVFRWFLWLFFVRCYCFLLLCFIALLFLSFFFSRSLPFFFSLSSSSSEHSISSAAISSSYKLDASHPLLYNWLNSIIIDAYI